VRNLPPVSACITNQAGFQLFVNPSLNIEKKRKVIKYIHFVLLSIRSSFFDEATQETETKQVTQKSTELRRKEGKTSPPPKPRKKESDAVCTGRHSVQSFPRAVVVSAWSVSGG